MANLKHIIWEGFKTGLKISGSILLFMIPISFAITVLQFYGIIDKLAVPFTPLFKHLGLSGETVIVYFTGVLVNCYSAIAIVITMPLTLKEITILAAILLIAHNMPIESMIQKKAGANALLITIIRLVMSIFLGYILNLIIPESGEILHRNFSPEATLSLTGTLLLWLSTNSILILKILVIINVLTVLNRILDHYGIIRTISGLFKPLMALFGISSETTVVWLAANLFGLVYGSGIILSQDKEKLSVYDLNKLHISIGISHSLIQETLIFVVIGAPLFWVTIPRIISAIVAVWIFILVKQLRIKTVHPELNN
ncbi:hypothetical protein ACE1ET_12820 [Saccharicrinis sp. FJH62]|uniref:hypothetical protein n=1 Tax=Saccharicrinis sp. FJH62 TaxID=3344657 RepID=UPI0035D4F7D6